MMTSFEKNWDQAVASHPAGNILQTSLWGRLKADFGWSWEVVGYQGVDSVCAGAMVLYKKLPVSLGCIAYVPRGPVVNWDDRTAIDSVLSSVEQASRNRKAWAVSLEPEVTKGESVEDILLSRGYRRGTRTVQPPTTIVIDISDDEDAILARMKSKTRYNIRLSLRKGVDVREGNLDDVGTFYKLMQETGVRDEFGIHSQSYYQRLLELFIPAGQAALLIATVENEPVAALLILAMGHKAWYIAGASSNLHRNLMPTYAAQWEAIRWAKAKGCTSYDLWGVPDANEEILEAQFTERYDGLWGVYRFKRGFGGELVRYTGLWEKALSPLYPFAAKLYNRIRG